MAVPHRNKSTNVAYDATKRENQDTFVAGMALRVQELASLRGFNATSLGEAVGIASSSASNYWTGKRPWPIGAIPRLADTLSTNVEFLLRGTQPSAALLRDADDADWINVPEHDLRELTDDSLGPVSSQTPIRRDWLYRTFGSATGIWLSRLPADLPRLELREGDLVFMRRVEPGEARDGAIYVVRVWGHLTVARIDAMLGNQMKADRHLEERVISPSDIGTEDGKAILVARILGAPLRRL